MSTDCPIEIPDRRAMTACGESLAAELRHGDVVLLHGDLGAGKTTLAQGIVAGLGVDGLVQSPTFSLVAEYDGATADGKPVRVFHLDLYRLTDIHELEGIGYGQFLSPGEAISIVEWPERAGDWLPERFWLLRITHGESGGRRIVRSWHDRSAHGPDGESG